MACVMIVDDNAALREILRVYLADAGYMIVETGDGEIALRLAREEQIDLAVLDVILPGCSGVAVLETLRHTSRMPVLLMSSLSESEVAWEAYGANGFMRKPLRPKEMVSRVTDLLALAREESWQETSSAMHAPEALSGHA